MVLQRSLSLLTRVYMLQRSRLLLWPFWYSEHNGRRCRVSSRLLSLSLLFVLQ